MEPVAGTPVHNFNAAGNFNETGILAAGDYHFRAQTRADPDNSFGGGFFSVALDHSVTLTLQEHTTTGGQIPEPGTCVIWGLLSAIGLCHARRKQRRKAT